MRNMPRSVNGLKWALIFCLLVFCILAFKLGESLIFSGESRRPASSGGGLDLSEHDTPQFLLLARIRLAEGLDTQVTDGTIRLRAGHFLGPRHSISVCSTFPQIEYEFGSSDQAVSGEPVILKIIGDCTADSSGKNLEYLDLQIEKLRAQKFAPGEFQIYGKRNVTVRLSNTGDAWPEQWSLRSLRLFNSLGEIRVEGEEVYRLRGRPTEMRWK